jgi:hypothetical protein
MVGQIYLIQLIIGWTCVGVFVATALITLLSIVGLVQIDPDIRNKLFTGLVLEVVAIGIAVFAGLLQVDPKPIAQEIAESVRAQQTLQEIETTVTANATADGPATPVPQASVSAEITPRVYIHIADTGQREIAEKAQQAVRDAGQLAPGIENVGSRAPSRTQLRYFLADEGELAAEIEEELAAAGVDAPPVLIKGFENANIRPHHFELWFGSSGI